MLELLKQKGYTGTTNTSEIIDWLTTKDILVDIIHAINEDDNYKFTGYYCRCKIPPYEATKLTELYKSGEDALEVLIYNILDYIK